MRVVAEAVRAARLRHDLPAQLPSAMIGSGSSAWRIEHDHAIVVRAPVVLAGEHGDQLLVVARVLGFAPGRRPGGATPANRAECTPGLPSSALDADAGVVGERGQAGAPARVARLGERVLDEGSVRFLGVGDPRGSPAERSRFRAGRAGASNSRSFPGLDEASTSFFMGSGAG